MDQSDIDQSIVVTGVKTETGLNNQKNTTPAQICQICGAFLTIDPSVLNSNQNSFKQLGNTYCPDDSETIFSGNLDPEMELSMSPIVAPFNNLTERSTNTNFDEEIDLSTKTFEPLFRKSVPPRSFYLCPTTINIIDSTSNNQSTANNEQTVDWHSKINSVSSLFDLMSSTSNIDHPLCEECADKLVNELDSQCRIVEKEHSDYTMLINRLNTEIPSEEEILQLERELNDLDLEEKDLLSKLDQAEQKEKILIEDKEKYLIEEANLLQQEQGYLLEYSNLKRALVKLEEKQESLDNQLKNTRFHFNRLRSIHVLNATFHIWHSGPFGTINYFRLGCMPNIKVEWEEINAALGQALLLLYCLAKKIKLEFKRFRLVPYGSFSYLEVIENCPNYKMGEVYNIYELRTTNYFLNLDKKFDKGLIAFLDCLKQLEDKIKSMDSNFSMPYKINGDKLEDKNSSGYSVKFKFNSYEEWTKALKFMLTNLKWSLAWVTSQKNNTSN
uniref:Beclin1 n=1 Tax=Brachionus calyciflorus TaxID=104777 RepID=A0A2Z4EUS0_9BILA|nr:beclin1 [Brachionus calyciflorus]